MWYLFGIVRGGTKRDFGRIGFTDSYGNKSSVEAIPFKDIAMVVSELDEWKVNEQDKKILMDKLLTHQKALEEVMKRELVIPIRFGAVVNDKEDINTIIGKSYQAFVKTLDDMENKFEVNLTVSWDISIELKKIAEEDEEIRTIKRKAEEIKSKELIMKVGMALEGKIEERRKEVAAEIFKYFDSSYGDTIEHERLKNEMILNSSFLVSREREEQFLDTIHQLDKKFGGRFNFRCLMPLPPHSFRTIVVQRITPERLRKGMDLFDINENTTLEGLKQKNRELTQNYHPDLAKKSNQEEMFSEVHQTYDLFKTFFEWQEKPFHNIDTNRCYLIRVLEGGV